MGVKQLLLGCGIPHLGNIPQKTPPSLPPSRCLPGESGAASLPRLLIFFQPGVKFSRIREKAAAANET